MKSKLIQKGNRVVSRIHLNPAQLYNKAVDARISVNVCGRGTGKTEGITGPWLLDRLTAMPGCVGGLMIPDYKVEEKILSGVYLCFEQFGFKRGVHYNVGTTPPAHFKRGRRFPEKDFAHFVSFYNGSGFYILSARAKHNGSNLDFLAVEEGKLIPEQRFRETVLAVRGNEDVFGKLYQHKSILIVSDMPRPWEKEHDWFLQFRQKSTPNICKQILQIQAILQQDERRADAEELRNLVKELRKRAVSFNTASTLDNIHALGLNYIRTMIASMSKADIATSVLNLEARQGGNAFYPLWSEKKHGYRIGYHLPHDDRNWLTDKDYFATEPIHIAADYNQAISCLTIGQLQLGNLKIINSLYVLAPLDLKDLARKFDDYYKNSPCRIVYYHFDRTARQGRSAISAMRFHESFTQELQSLGWTVIEQMFYNQFTYQDKYRLWALLLRMGKISFNLENCHYLNLSIQNTRCYQDESGALKKDKSGEKKPQLDQRLQTHFGEAADSLIEGLFAEVITDTATTDVP